MAKKKNPQIEVTLIRSIHGQTPRQRKTAEALGLRKINQTVNVPDNESMRGMIDCIAHLVEVEES